MATDMFYGASPELFVKAKQLRRNQTPAEKRLWTYLNANRLGGFRFKAQHPLHQFIADFYCHAARLVIELDGSVHDTLEQREYDENRTYMIEEFGIRVIRFRNQEVFSTINSVLEIIKQYLSEAVDEDVATTPWPPEGGATGNNTPFRGLGSGPVPLFNEYMRLTGTPTLADEPGSDPALVGRKLGVVNGSNWVSLWSTYFGRTLLPGVKLVQVGNEGVQLKFMDAHHRGEACPPQVNIDLTIRYATDLIDLVGVDAILLTCSTMNRAAPAVRAALTPLGVPVVQIDEAMMEEAVQTVNDGNILVVATHGPTVASTQALLQETADRLGRRVRFAGATVEDAFHLLGDGRIDEHNTLIANAIRDAQQHEAIDVVVLAQLSMSVFCFSYPDPVGTFGVPVLNSGETGFRRVGEVLKQLPAALATLPPTPSAT